MKFLELNKKRHATKHFIDKPVDPKDVRTAMKSQPWHQALTTVSLGSLLWFVREMLN